MVTQRRCSVEGCDSSHKIRKGLCVKHYMRMRMRGTTDPRPPWVPSQCLIDDCLSDAVTRGLCRLHYSRWQRRGDALHKPRVPVKDCIVEGCAEPHSALGYCQVHYRLSRPECEVDGCAKPRVGRGLCSTHYMRWKMHGDPNVVFPKGQGEWKDPELLTYDGVHRRVRKHRGKARDYSCTLCPEQAAEWSYDHKDPDERTTWVTGQTGNQIMVVFSHKIEHYEPLCRSCHRRRDPRRPK